MLVKVFRFYPSVLVLLAFCALFGWHLSSGIAYGDPMPRQRPGESHPPAEAERPQEQKEQPVPPRKARIAIVTFITDQKSYIHLSLKNKDHYARRHGHDLIVDYESHSERGTTYWKFNMMQRLIKKNNWDWLWWMDFDTLITNTDIDVQSIIDETLKETTRADEVDVLVTHDCNGLNTGSFIVRGHERSLKIFDDVHDIQAREKEKKNELSEQDAMALLIKEDRASADRTTQVPQWKLNAFPPEIACFDESNRVWEHGTFVLHFAGAWAHVEGEDPTGQLMNKYGTEIIWGDWKEFY
ncbi:glycosyltransferase family 34 protein [Aaosphaeria arxii CBS 175.79]|uniref:Glycosyltransferase family 34 protein n=1 Tax=Aaosphaeria arxii CBS 175.79 TaxID=1450172 RepID=A0A6A5XJS3_9PLEO|nr:glycosyltransferase family 34 protein [Aaosphaeria arxii CBS 175.79]KAF2013091.1 glycosyltransferase family 34 protein [Aaosphaeria arxii CBS 175.79]